jgi:hypothetical protein
LFYVVFHVFTPRGVAGVKLTPIRI